MKIKKSKNGYTVHYRDLQGNPHQKKIDAGSLSEAKQIVEASGIADIDRAAQAGALTQEVLSKITWGKKATTQDSIQDFAEWLEDTGREPRTAHNVVAHVTQWATWAGKLDQSLMTVTRKDVHDYINRSDGGKLSTRKQALYSLNTFFDYASHSGLVVGNPARLVKVLVKNLSMSDKEPRAIQPMAEFDFYRAFDFLTRVMTSPVFAKNSFSKTAQFWRTALVLSYATGLRLGDICLLHSDSLQGESLVVWTDKRDYRVELPLNCPSIQVLGLKDVLEELRQRDQGFLFPRERSLYEDPKRRSTLSQEFTRWMKKAEIKGVSFHSLRHAFVTRLSQEGKTLEEIGRLVAHRDVSTTSRYNHG